METDSADSSGGTDHGVIEIIPMDEYDSQKAKLRCSIRWILTKAYKEGVPKEFRDPFYTTPEGNIHVKPRLANLMMTSELYCQACSNMFGESSSQWKGHWSIIQVLSRKGIYIGDNDDTEVTETILMKNAPFQTNAHVCLIDALMMAYISEVVSIERVVQSVRKYATFNASSELPNDIYDALVFWVNKICVATQHILDQNIRGQTDQVLQGESQQKVRIVSKSTLRESVTVPIMEDFLSDIGDGCSLATLISFYCPTALQFDDICLKSSIGIADSLYNLQLVRSFCDNHVPGHCFLLTYEDFLYTSDKLRLNLYVFMAEVFYWFEVQRLDCISEHPGSYLRGEVSRPTTAKLLSNAGINSLPISNATKQSFQRSPSDDLGMGMTPTSVGAGVPQRQPLLHKRLQQQPHYGSGPIETENVHDSHSSVQQKQARRSQSLSEQEDRDVIQQSVIAWQDKRQPTRSSSDLACQSRQSTGSSTLLANVSIDSELNDSFSDDRFSMDLGDLSDGNTPPPTLSQHSLTSNLRNPNHPDYIELQSVTSGATTLRISRSEDTRVSENLSQAVDQSGGLVHQFLGRNDQSGSVSHSNVEPLLLAKLRPAKEKSNHHSKEIERGDRDRRKLSSPPKGAPPTRGSLTSSVISDSSDSSLRDVVTPLSEGQLSDRNESPRIPMSTQQQNYAAFTVQPDLSQSTQLSDRPRGDSRAEVVKTSYTISDQAYTPEMARAAGIPVVSDSNSNAMLQRWGSREGSIASSRSSGDYSDHESHKIHCDHKDRESDPRLTRKVITKSNSSSSDKFTNMQNKPIVIKTCTPPVGDQKLPNTTSFAEIKRMKQNVGHIDNSGFVYMIKGQEPTESRKSALHDNSQQRDRTRPEKKTTFAALPNQMTWQQTSQTQPDSSSSGSGNSENIENGEVSGAMSSDLLQIRLKLEEKRKMIERKKHRMEAQHQKMRQRLGKTAFLQVVQKPDGDKPQEILNGRIPEMRDDDQGYSSHTLPRSTGNVGRPRSLDRETRSLDRDIPGARAVQHDPHGQGHGDVPGEHSQSQRPFSREGIQQTIENVRKKWFKEDDVLMPSRSLAENERTNDESSRRMSSPRMSRSDDKISESPSHRMSLSDGPQQRMSESPPQRMFMSGGSQQRMSESPPQRIFMSGGSQQRISESQPQRILVSGGSQQRMSEGRPQRMLVSDESQQRLSESPPQRILVSGGSQQRMSESPPQRILVSGGSPQRLSESPPQRILVSGGSQQRMSESPPQRILVSGGSQQRMSESPPQRMLVSDGSEQRMSESPPRHLEMRGPQEGSGKKTEDPKQYNKSLDKLNQSLCDLQGEIKRLNLQQDQLKTMKIDTGSSQPVNEQIRDSLNTERSAAPSRQGTKHVDVHGSLSEAALPTPERMGKGTSESHFPQQSTTVHPGYQQTMPSGQSAHPGAYTCQHQFVNMPPAPVIYSGYQPHPQPAPHYVPQQFPPTPPHGYPPSPAFPHQYMSPGSQFGVPAVSSHYGMGVQPFQPPPPIASTYTVPSYPGYTSSSTTFVGGVPSHMGAQPYHPTSAANIPSQSVSGGQALQSNVPDNAKTMAPEVSQPPFDNHVTKSDTKSQDSRSDDSGSVDSAGANSVGQNGGFFVCFGDGSPKRTKPALGKERGRKDQAYPLADQDNTPAPSSQATVVASMGQTQDSNSASQQRAKWDIPPQGHQNVSQVVIGGSPTVSDQSQVPAETPVVFEVDTEIVPQEQLQEDEMQRRKEKLIQMQIKRKEDHERKRSYKEMEMARKKEQERIKQEEADRKKQEDKARRELIFRQYQEKKRQQEEEGGDEFDRPVQRREKAPAKPRPKSMHVTKTKLKSGSEEGLQSNSSQEDLSSQAFTGSPGHTGSSPGYRRTHGLAPPRGKMRKAVSCNTLMTSSADGKSLAFGGMTHRRPPSPDLYGRGRRSKANTESSDTGSYTGSNPGADYAGPKLFVKPSSKSNRHIIINAISHCCLAGCVNSDLKAKVLEEMAKSEAKHFIILFRDHSCQYRSVYEYYPETEDIYKIHGIGPKQITNKMIEKFYKYNSGTKGFSEISSTKHISVSIDAVALQSALWKLTRVAAKK